MSGYSNGNFVNSSLSGYYGYGTCLSAYLTGTICGYYDVILVTVSLCIYMDTIMLFL